MEPAGIAIVCLFGALVIAVVVKNLKGRNQGQG